MAFKRKIAWTEEMLEQLERMVSAGERTVDIAKVVGVSQNVCYKKIYSLGLKCGEPLEIQRAKEAAGKQAELIEKAFEDKYEVGMRIFWEGENREILEKTKYLLILSGERYKTTASMSDLLEKRKII